MILVGLVIIAIIFAILELVSDSIRERWWLFKEDLRWERKLDEAVTMAENGMQQHEISKALGVSLDEADKLLKAAKYLQRTETKDDPNDGR